MQRYTVYFIWKLLYMSWVVPSPIIRSENNCIYSIWYLLRRYCYLPLSWKSWNWFECAVGGVHGSHHNEPVRRAEARKQTTEHYMNQVVAHKQQLKIPLMMGW